MRVSQLKILIMKAMKEEKKVAVKQVKVQIKKRTRSIKLTIFLMRVLGMWHTTKRKEKILSNTMLSITLGSILYSIFVQFQDLYHSRRNLTMLTFVAPVACLVVTELLKVIVFIVNREKIMRLNGFIAKHLWSREHAETEIEIFNECDRLCTRAIAAFIYFAQSTCWHYLFIPALEVNTTTRRELPFPIRFDWPIIFETPYYEIFYVAQMFGALAVAMCTITFASYLFVINLFTAAHFKILNLHLTSLCDFPQTFIKEKQTASEAEARRKLRKCIADHQMLIDLTKQIEDLYCYVMLGQVFFSAAELCFTLLQILFAKATFHRNILSVNFLLTCTFQLYFYCYSSHEIFESSENIAQGIYSMKWFRIVDPRIHRDFARSIQIIACRTRRPCTLSVGKFYPLTLQVFSSVLKTSVSYFTILRQISEGMTDRAQ